MIKKSNKNSLAIFVIGVFILSVVGIVGLGVTPINATTSKTSSKNAIAGTIKLGATVSETGQYSTEGTRVENGYKMAIADINNAGGVKVGSSYYNLSLTLYDDQSDKSKAASLYDTLISTDKVDLLLGPYSSSIVLSVAPKADQAKIPMVQAGGASDSIYQQGYTYVFGLYHPGSTYSQPIFTYLNDTNHNSDIKSAAIFLENSAFPISVKNGTDTYLANAGITNVKVYTYTSGDLNAIATDMSDLAANGGADMIIGSGHYADAVKMVQEIYANQLQPKIIFGTVGIAEPAFVAAVGNQSEGAFGFAQWVTNLPESSAPGITAFVKAYNDTYGELPAYHAAGGYAAIQVVKAAVEKAGTFTDHVAVRNALASLNVDTIWGNVQFASTGVIKGSGFMVQIQNGNIETVYPSTYASASVIYPMKWSSSSVQSPGFEVFLLLGAFVTIIALRKNTKKHN